MKKHFATYCGSALLTLALVACPGSEPPQLAPDTQAPSVALQPVEPVSAAGTVTLRATASDNVGVTEVEFYNGDTLLGEDTSSPYSFDWLVSSANNGANALKATAYDTAGNVGTSDTLQVQVSVPVERRVGVTGAVLSGGAVLVSEPGASAGNNGNVAKLAKTNAAVEITMPGDLIASTYALELKVRVDQFGGTPDVVLTLDGSVYARVSAANTKELNDLTVNSALASLKPGSKLVARLETDDLGGKRVAYIDSVKLNPAMAPPTETPREPGKFTVQVIKTGLTFPSSIAFEPDGKLLIMSRGNLEAADWSTSAKLFRLDVNNPDSLTEILGMPKVFLAYGAQETFNGGAVGLALDADYANNKKLYICYHYLPANGNPNDEQARRNRLSSFVVRDNRLQDEAVLIDDIPGGSNHNGCRIAQGADGTIYMTTGDANTRTTTKLSQDLNSLAGKVLRVNRDGSAPADNPYYAAGNRNRSLVWTLGMRNPQGLAFEPGTGALWSAEHGEATRDELNVIERSKNYGWPYCEGTVLTCPQVTTGTYRPAVEGFYSNYESSTIAPSDVAFYTGNAFPEWQGDLFLVTLKTGRLIRYDLNGQQIVNAEGSTLLSMTTPSDPYYNENYGRFRDVAVGPDGFIYVSTDPTKAGLNGVRQPNPLGGFLLRIRP